MPQKVREQKRDMARANWYIVSGGGKGSHTKWKHPLVERTVIISGNDGADSSPGQAKDVAEALKEAAQAERRDA